MQYHHFSIYTDDTLETYNKISDILGLTPIDVESNKEIGNKYGVWTYSVDVHEDEPYFDFINNFLDIIEPKFEELKKLGIQKNDISFWYLYEYSQQCNMEFHPKEMKRLGENGIVLCISCWENNINDNMNA